MLNWSCSDVENIKMNLNGRKSQMVFFTRVGPRKDSKNLGSDFQGGTESEKYQKTWKKEMKLQWYINGISTHSAVRT